MGGGHRVARLRYGAGGGNFWAALDPILLEHRDMMDARHLQLPLSL